MRSFYSLLIILFCYLSCLAQYEQKNDSLLNILERVKQDTAKVNILNELFYLHFYEHPEKSRKYIQQAKTLSEQLNDTKWIIECNNNLAYWLRVRGKYDESLKYYAIALDQAREHTLNKEISEALQGIGNIYWRKADYQKSRKYFEENLAFCKEIDDKGGIASSYNNMGNIYNEEGNYSRALEHYIQASKINAAINNERDYAINLGNIGLMQAQLKHFQKAIEYYSDSRTIAERLNESEIITWIDRNIGLNYKYLKEYDKAIESYRKTLNAYKKRGEVAEVAEVYRLIGNLYLDMDSLDKASEHYLKSLEINEDLNDSSEIAFNSNRLSDVNIQKENWDEALFYSLQAKQIGESLMNPTIIMSAEADLSTIYSAKEDFSKAYESLSHHMQIKDSLVGIESNNTAQEMEARFQNELKEQEIEKLNAENEIKALNLIKRENERNYILGISILILLLGALIFRMYKTQTKTNKKLQELDKLKTRFFANISHEFRTPLTLILGIVAEKLNNASGKRQEDLHTIKRNANRLSSLISQLLDLSKLEARSLKLNVVKKDIDEHLRIVAASFSSLASRKNISFSKELLTEKTDAWFDPEKLDKILYNLLYNAFKFTEEGGLVRLHAQLEEHEIMIKVEDSGLGIPEDQIKHIFDRFYQADNIRNLTKPGAGIGLALVKELVELHRGTINVKSEPGSGSTFTIRLPVNDNAYKKDEFAEHTDISSDKTELPIESPERENAAEIKEEDNNERFVILVVEDDQDMRNFIARTLQRDYKVLQASNGSEGIKKALKAVPDLIITDLMMPESDGIALCNNIRAEEITSHIPVIMLTAKADLDSKLEGLETGADDYITKPFEGKELKVRIKNLIQLRQKLRMKFSKSIYLQPNEVAITPKDEVFLTNVMSIVEKYMDKSDFSSADFQKEIGYSRMQLHRKLKALTNHSASEFIRIQRLKRASQLLLTSDLNISEVCYMTGFSNLSYFTRSFRSQFGLSPKEFVQKNKHVKTTS